MTTDGGMLNDVGTTTLAVAGLVAPLNVPPLCMALCAVDLGLCAHLCWALRCFVLVGGWKMLLKYGNCYYLRDWTCASVFWLVVTDCDCV